MFWREHSILPTIFEPIYFVEGRYYNVKYISLVKYTAKGAENVKDSPNRLDAFKGLCEFMGAKVGGFYLTMGRCDMLVILDAPNPETVAKIILATSSRGAVSTETLQAFSKEEYRKIVSELP